MLKTIIIKDKIYIIDTNIKERLENDWCICFSEIEEHPDESLIRWSSLNNCCGCRKIVQTSDETIDTAKQLSKNRISTISTSLKGEFKTGKNYVYSLIDDIDNLYYCFVVDGSLGHFSNVNKNGKDDCWKSLNDATLVTVMERLDENI